MKTFQTFSHQKAKVLLVALLFSAVGCQSPQKTPYQNDAISSAHPEATKAGNLIFEKGGNAYDAAVAAGFALAVVEPSMSGLGGRLQALYHTQSGTLHGIDATTAVPQAYQQPEERFAYGYKTIGIPGVVAGLIKLHKAGGVLALDVVMQPAIALAEKGFKLLPGEALRQQMAASQIAEFEGSRNYFLDNKQNSRPAGALWVQSDLAAVLKTIATAGHKGFYEGQIAQQMVDDIQSHGGILSLEDLKNYEALDAQVLKGSFKGNDIYGLFLPSYGAISIQILQLMEALEGQSAQKENWPYLMGLATAKAYEYRRYQTNPDSLSTILSKEKAVQWAATQNLTRPLVAAQSKDWPESWRVAMGHTTHLTTADRWGNIVSLTQTVGPNMGSKVASPGLGFLYAVTLGGYLGNYKPGDRAASHISPIIALQNGKPLLALGAAGGSRIPPAVTQTLHRYLAQGLRLEDALAAPRVYPENDTLLLEAHPGLDWDAVALKILEEKGTPYKRIQTEARFGRVHAIALDTLQMRWNAAADPDWEGTAID
ncbi:MAG: gamma-glutamyltransferase [Flavobacteriaceae bacterium]